MKPLQADPGERGVVDPSSAIERIRGLSCWQSPPRIRAISDGRTNQNYFVHAGNRTFFARLGVDLPHHGITRANEVRCCRLAAAADIAPKVVFAVEGVLVTEFIDGRTLVQGEPISDEILVRLAQGLRHLHESEVPADLAPFDPVERCRRQLAALPDSAVSPTRRRRVLEILQRAPRREARSLIHGDLIPENVIVRDDALFLVDWEYAGLGDPLVDLAMVGVHFGLPERRRQNFYFSYGDVDPDAVARLVPAIAAREAVWCATQIHFVSLAGDLDGYARMCWDRIGVEP